MRCLPAILLASAALCAAEGDEFFESRIRPVLVEKCYGCHSAKLRETKANLQLDSRAALRKGGDSGPVVVPGKPDESRLWKAVSYTDFHLRMPPTGKLTRRRKPMAQCGHAPRAPHSHAL